MWGLIPLVLNLGGKVVPLLTGPVTQFITGININQILSNATNALAATVKFAQKHWKLCLIVLLAAGNVVGFYGWQHTDQALKAERAAHQADIKSYKTAQAAADAAAKAQVQQVIQESKVKADEADKNYSTLLDKYRTNLLRYQADHGGTQSTGGHQTDSQASQTSASFDGPSSSPLIPQGFLTITIGDAQICATNTARLQAAHDWAVHLGDDNAQ